MEKSNESRRNVIIVVSIFVVIIAVAVGFWFISIRSDVQSSQTQMVTMPLIQTSVTSEAGGIRPFEARVTVEFDNSVRNSDIDLDRLQAQIQSVLSDLNYEDIIGMGGMNIIRNNIYNVVSTDFNEGDIHGIFITDVLNDFVSIPPPQRDRNQRANEFIQGLFQRN